MPEPGRASCSERFRVLTARCSRDQAETLLAYDHYYEWIAGHAGVLLTYPWMERTELRDDLQLSAMFTDAATCHPPAPRAIQELIDQRVFAHS